MTELSVWKWFFIIQAHSRSIERWINFCRSKFDLSLWLNQGFLNHLGLVDLLFCFYIFASVLKRFPVKISEKSFIFQNFEIPLCYFLLIVRLLTSQKGTLIVISSILWLCLPFNKLQISIFNSYVCLLPRLKKQTNRTSRTISSLSSTYIIQTSCTPCQWRALHCARRETWSYSCYISYPDCPYPVDHCALRHIPPKHLLITVLLSINITSAVLSPAIISYRNYCN